MIAERQENQNADGHRRADRRCRKSYNYAEIKFYLSREIAIDMADGF